MKTSNSGFGVTNAPSKEDRPVHFGEESRKNALAPVHEEWMHGVRKVLRQLLVYYVCIVPQRHRVASQEMCLCVNLLTTLCLPLTIQQ